ncbi:hypothetical protein E2C01_099367 [Portunus trituberculatus]|uniref:Uncharacterized protein n=1 Tax=Portunus trituberculatus TaxID=210409 RepID=A0A5B7KAT1_PORTR|nr:hypothetical protein [Portunus trituberculatus]
MITEFSYPFLCRAKLGGAVRGDPGAVTQEERKGDGGEVTSGCTLEGVAGKLKVRGVLTCCGQSGCGGVVVCG